MAALPSRLSPPHSSSFSLLPPAVVVASAADAPPSFTVASVKALFERHLPFLLQILVLQAHFKGGGNVLAPSEMGIRLASTLRIDLSRVYYYSKDEYTAWLDQASKKIKAIYQEIEEMVESTSAAKVINPLRIFAQFVIATLSLSGENFSRPFREQQANSMVAALVSWVAAERMERISGTIATFDHWVNTVSTDLPKIISELDDPLKSFLHTLFGPVSQGYVFLLEPLVMGDKIYIGTGDFIWISPKEKISLLQAAKRKATQWVSGTQCDLASTVKWVEGYKGALLAVQKKINAIDGPERIACAALSLHLTLPILEGAANNLTTLSVTYEPTGAYALVVKFKGLLEDVKGLLEGMRKHLSADDWVQALSKFGIDPSTWIPSQEQLNPALLELHSADSDPADVDDDLAPMPAAAASAEPPSEAAASSSGASSEAPSE